MKRGEIWTVAGGGDYASKPRPALIVQDDAFEATQSVTLCLITTMLADAETVRVTLEPDAANGLAVTSQVMADKISTVQRRKLGKRLGELSKAEMAHVDRAMMVFLGLAG